MINGSILSKKNKINERRETHLNNKTVIDPVSQ